MVVSASEETGEETVEEEAAEEAEEEEPFSCVPQELSTNAVIQDARNIWDTRFVYFIKKPPILDIVLCPLLAFIITI